MASCADWSRTILSPLIPRFTATAAAFSLALTSAAAVKNWFSSSNELGRWSSWPGGWS